MQINRQLVHAEKTTTVCPKCGGRRLSLIGTQRIKMCLDCPTDIVWKRKEGEPNLYGGPVEIEK